MNFLNWKSNSASIQDILNRILKLDGEEVVKFLQDILDTIFSLFSTEDGKSTQVFHDLWLIALSKYFKCS